MRRACTTHARAERASGQSNRRRVEGERRAAEEPAERSASCRLAARGACDFERRVGHIELKSLLVGQQELVRIAQELVKEGRAHQAYARVATRQTRAQRLIRRPPLEDEDLVHAPHRQPRGQHTEQRGGTVGADGDEARGARGQRRVATEATRDHVGGRLLSAGRRAASCSLSERLRTMSNCESSPTPVMMHSTQRVAEGTVLRRIWPVADQRTGQPLGN